VNARHAFLGKQRPATATSQSASDQQETTYTSRIVKDRLEPQLLGHILWQHGIAQLCFTLQAHLLCPMQGLHRAQSARRQRRRQRHHPRAAHGDVGQPWAYGDQRASRLDTDHEPGRLSAAAAAGDDAHGSLAASPEGAADRGSVAAAPGPSRARSLAPARSLASAGSLALSAAPPEWPPAAARSASSASSLLSPLPAKPVRAPAASLAALHEVWSVPGMRCTNHATAHARDSSATPRYIARLGADGASGAPQHGEASMLLVCLRMLLSFGSCACRAAWRGCGRSRGRGSA